MANTVINVNLEWTILQTSLPFKINSLNNIYTLILNYKDSLQGIQTILAGIIVGSIISFLIIGKLMVFIFKKIATDLIEKR